MSDEDKPPRVPACVDCVRRKVKCDRSSPCSSCVTAKIPCQFVQKRLGKKQRLHPSARYEEKLNYISHQLEELSSTLGSLVEVNGLPNRQTLAIFGSDTIPTTNSTLIEDPRDIVKVTDEGRHAPGSNDEREIQATAEDVVRTLLHDAKATDSLTSQDVVSQSCAFSHYPQLAGLSLPPMNHVLRLLTFLRASPQRYFADKPQLDEDEFAELCQKLYFPTQAFSIFAWINVNCGLFYLFRDLEESGCENLQLTRRQVSDNSVLCFHNIKKAAQNLNLCIPPSSEAVHGLVSAAAVNMESADGFLAWKLVCATARMSLDLGYHHLRAGSTDSETIKARKLFWYVYGMDKSLAFNFGRTSTIQDYDVSTERPTHADNFGSKWGFSLLDHLDFVKLQYEIYEQILSAKAQKEAPSTRTARAHEFEQRLAQIKDRFIMTLEQNSNSSPGITYSLELGFSSVLTLVYRELPLDNSSVAHAVETDKQCLPLFHISCVEAGRAALLALVHGWNAVLKEPDRNSTRTFVNLSLLFMPFMPFIAVFGSQIATGSREDLALLRDVVKVVETARDVSNAVNKMYRAFSKLLAIAELRTNTDSNRDQGPAQRQQTQSVAPCHLGVQVHAEGILPASEGSMLDASMINVDVPPSSMMDCQANEFDTLHQDWNTMFNEFDLGLGAESARDMMPWLEQHINGFGTFG